MVPAIRLFAQFVIIFYAMPIGVNPIFDRLHPKFSYFDNY